MKAYDKLCERYMTRQVRSFYPRKFELSQEFIDAFKLEYSRLLEAGQNRELYQRECVKLYPFIFNFCNTLTIYFNISDLTISNSLNLNVYIP